MESQLLLSLILFSSWVSLGFSQGIGGGLGGGADTSCISKLLPCQAYLKNPSSPPPTCCAPLKGMIADDPQCLCRLANNSELLKSVNVTKEELLKLPKGCNIEVDINAVCNKAETPTSSPATPPVPANSNGTDGNSTGNPTKKSSADGISPFGGLGLVATFSALVLSAF